MKTERWMNDDRFLNDRWTNGERTLNALWTVNASERWTMNTKLWTLNAWWAHGERTVIEHKNGKVERFRDCIYQYYMYFSHWHHFSFLIIINIFNPPLLFLLSSCLIFMLKHKFYHAILSFQLIILRKLNFQLVFIFFRIFFGGNWCLVDQWH